MEEQEKKRAATGAQTGPTAVRSAGGVDLSELRVSDIENIYNRGFVENFEEVFFYEDWKGMDGAEQNLHIHVPPKQTPVLSQESKKSK